MNKSIGSLVDRLRGIYRVPISDGLGAAGAGEESDNPNEFVRKFDTPSIQHEAADVIVNFHMIIKMLNYIDRDSMTEHDEALLEAVFERAKLFQEYFQD